MFETEYVRNCNCNYERIHLEEKPKEKRYQYCILSRGGIRHLLPASLRYIDGEAYLYYDISSTQNVHQLFAQRTIKREWMKDLLWGIRQLHSELDRFLLEDQSIIWCPEQVFQDLEKNDFFFVYVPYYKGESGLTELMDFLVERVDYEDDALVEFVYEVYEQLKQIGAEYLRKQIHEDWSKLERREKTEREEAEERQEVQAICETIAVQRKEQSFNGEKNLSKKGLWFFKENRGKRRKEKEDYREKLRQRMTGMESLAVCEETVYEGTNVEKSRRLQEKQNATTDDREQIAYRETDGGEEYGKTIYIEESVARREPALYKPDGELVMQMDNFPFVVGKKKENVNLAINDYSVSRVHAKITREEGVYYIEDLNSTNGTFKNGLRLQPYEKRRIEKGDELKFGKTEYIYR